MSFTEKFQTSLGDLVYLVRGKYSGEDGWHYVLVDKLKLPLFIENGKRGSIDVAEYGKVLYSGWGIDPPEEIVEAVKKEYS